MGWIYGVYLVVMMMEEEMSGCCGFMGGMGLWYFGSMEDVWWRW
jgi:hypothetical protein